MKLHRSILKTSGTLGVNFSFAFQPIVDVRTREINSFEALIRGPHGEPASCVLSKLLHEDVSAFHQSHTQTVMELANRLNISRKVNINLSADALYHVDLNIMGTFRSSLLGVFPVENIVFEVTESEDLTGQKVLLRNLKLLQDFGFQTAIDDFGAGYSGLKLLMEYQPNYVKLDRHLVSNIHNDKVKQVIFWGVRQMCERLSIDIVAEGIENRDEYLWLEQAGIDLFQGYYFAKPAFESLPVIGNRCFSQAS